MRGPWMCVSGLAALLLGGCTVGPNFQAPRWASPGSWLSGTNQHETAEFVPSRTVAAPIDPDWWNIFHDRELTGLERQVAGSNLDVRTAGERVLQSRAVLGVTGSARYPVFNANASIERELPSGEGVFSALIPSAGAPGTEASGAFGSVAGQVATTPNFPALNIFQYGFDTSWEPDIWGGVRRSIEAGRASVAAAGWAQRAALVSALAEVARDYVTLRGTQEQLRIARENLKTANQALGLTRQRAQQGVTSDLDVANAAAQVRTVASEIPSLEARQRELTNALALLLAKPPGALARELDVAKPVPPVPPRVPVGVPSELLRRRPDIREAEARLHEATANVGVATANFYPSVTLSASLGFQALQLGNLFKTNAVQYAAGPGITLPIFEGGRLRYTLQLRKASQREAALNFDRTLLTAWHEVDNALTSYADEQRRRAELIDAVAQNRRALGLAQMQYQAGVTDFLQVLTAERSLLSAEQALASSTTTVSSDLVALYKALGGGWKYAERGARS